MKVRLAEPDDVPAVRSLLVDVVSKLSIYSEAARSSEIAHYQEDTLLEIQKNGIMVVAKRGGELDGFCFGYDDDELLWLSWFIVNPAQQGNGLGKNLVSDFMDQARYRTHKVWCDTRTTNFASISVLQKCGFEKVTTISRHWYNQDFIIWQRFTDR